MSSALRSSFIDRDREIEDLRRLTQRAGPVLAILYGRRRVGKTFLLQHAWPGQRQFYFLAADLPAAVNRLELVRDLAAWSGLPIDLRDYPTWRSVFRLLVDLAADEPLVAVLDEFQYMLQESEDDAASQLAAVWDREAQGRPLTLVLCGSEVATMQGLQGGGQPLYGRANWSARIRPFDYRDAARMAPHLNPREAALLYGIFGGTPRYLSVVGERDTVAEAAIREFLSPRGEVFLQLETLVEQEKGIRDPAPYRAALVAVAAGKTTLNEIAQAMGPAYELLAARKILSVLEALELIERERNFDARRTAPYRYRISDNAVRFWHRFVHPNRGRLETGDAREVWGGLVAPFLNEYMGKVFEHICREAFVRYHAQWGLMGAWEWSRWEGRDRNGRSIELDIVARLDDGRLLTGEIKWSSHPVGVDVHYDLTRSLEDLARSGYGWAHEALDPNRSAGHIYFSAAGFADELRERAARAGAMRLVSLEEMYDITARRRPG
jgi:AAA+ ATPase superfamily predicted ATPase